MIVIPMAGLSKRFGDAGYKEPKYMLKLGKRTVFECSVMSFKNYFDCERFVFICRDDFNTPEFVKDQSISIGVKNFEVIILDSPTRGQAETVYKGLAKFGDYEQITIFNIDTFRPGFKYPSFLNKDVDGYLETFIGTGKNWSNILPGDNYEVIETAEKKGISELCCTGIYYFSRLGDFSRSFKNSINKKLHEIDYGELYVAPLYNYLIKHGSNIKYSVIEKSEVIFCGTPQKYTNCCQDKM